MHVHVDQQIVGRYTGLAHVEPFTKGDAPCRANVVEFLNGLGLDLDVAGYTLDTDEDGNTNWYKKDSPKWTFGANDTINGWTNVLLKYTTPIQPNDTGAVNSASAQVRKNGTVKLTLTPSTNCVGTAEEIKSELQKAAPNAVVSVTEKDGSFEAVIRNVTEALAVNTDNLFHKTYAITANKAENGSVSASAARAKAGDTVTLTAAPASGYQLKTLTLTPETALDKTVSASTLTYTFTMPANDVAVTAAFAVKPSSGGGGAGGGAVAPAPTDSGSSSITAPDGTKVPATVEVKNGTAAVSADSSKLTAVSGKDSLTLDLSADSTVRTVSLTGDVYLLHESAWHRGK